MTNAVATRLQRSSPDEVMIYKDWVIPPGVSSWSLMLSVDFADCSKQTPVGMTSMFLHNNEDIFPNAQSFIPERWMDTEQRKALEKYLVPFSKGSRQCVGIPCVANHQWWISNCWANTKFQPRPSRNSLGRCHNFSRIRDGALRDYYRWRANSTRYV